MADVVRIDKLLWALRVYKTRSEATDACKGGKVKLAGTNAKPSHMVKVGDTIVVRKGVAQFTYRIKQLTESRLGAKLVPDYAENLTPQEEIDKMKAPAETFFVRRERGQGRPTKRDRRVMEGALENLEASASMDEIPDDIAARFGLLDDDD